MSDNTEIFIPFSVPSSKNSKISTRKGVFMSKAVSEYIRALGIQYFSSSKKIVKGYVDINRPNLFKKAFNDKNWVKPEGQTIIAFHFVRKTRHKFDFINACQIIHDLMVAHDFIEDDNMDYLIPFPYKRNNKWYTYNKEKPGCYLKVIH